MAISENLKRNIERIDSLKDVLKTMPKNNEKNIDKYIERLQELIKEYSNYQEQIENELKNRFEKRVNIPINSEIKNLSDRLSTIDKAIYVLKHNETSFEKMELDKYIYKISKFYKDNLDNVNNQIALCINAFEKAGISLTADDFDYTIHVNEYMTVFLQEMKKGSINTDVLKKKFDDIYWRCSDIIVQIELNLRYLYLSNEQTIDKYFVKEAEDLLRKWQKAPNEIRNGYLEIKKKMLELINIDEKIIIDKFLNENLKPKDFTVEKIKSNLSGLIEDSALERTSNEELIENVLKFYNSLKEYKNYLTFKYIIDDVKNYYKERENYKKVYSETKKQIEDKEHKLKKINKKLSGTGLFGIKKDISKKSSEQTELISELKNLYKELDINKFYNKIYTEFNDETTLYDVLNLAASYYIYLTDVIIKNNKNITQEEIDEQIKQLDEFLTNPYNTLINNLTIIDEKDVALIIKDRYKLLEFKIERQDLQENNLDSILELLEQIIIGLNLKKIGLNPEEIEDIFEIKKLFKL